MAANQLNCDKLFIGSIGYFFGHSQVEAAEIN